MLTHNLNALIFLCKNRQRTEATENEKKVKIVTRNVLFLLHRLLLLTYCMYAVCPLVGLTLEI